MIKINPEIASFITGSLTPWVVALLVWVKASDVVKNIVNLVVSLVVAVFTQAVIVEQGVGWLSWNMAAVVIITFMTSATTYNNFWKKIFNPNKLALPDAGLGKKEEPNGT